jgi:hypothetical protein
MIEKIVAGAALFILTSLVTYAFKARQLYAVVPKLHKKSFLSDGGSVAELVVYNKGAKVEENISLEIRQELKCELLASNSSSAVINDNVIEIDRIHSHSEISMILMVEGEALSYDDLTSLSSKEIKGSFYKKVEEIPPRATDIATSITIIALFCGALYWGGDAYKYLESKYLRYNYSNIFDTGWRNISDYLASDLSESYSSQEFPVRFLGVEVGKEKLLVNYEIINKSSLPINVNIRDSQYSNYDIKTGLPFESIDVDPMEKKNLTVEYSSNKQEFLKLNASIDFGDEYIYGLEHNIDIKKNNK